MALKYAYKKSDYLLIFDADDSINGDFKVKSKFTADHYTLNFGIGFTYKRPLIINNQKRWIFKGVLHEYLRLKGLSQYIPFSHRKPKDNKNRKQQTQATEPNNKRRK
jgi:hypothetical protein